MHESVIEVTRDEHLAARVAARVVDQVPKSILRKLLYRALEEELERHRDGQIRSFHHGPYVAEDIWRRFEEHYQRYFDQKRL